MEESANLWRTALSGRVRWQNTRGETNPSAGLVTALRASRNVGKRLSLAVQAELSGEQQSRSFSQWHQRSLTGSAGVLLTKSAKLNLEFLRTEHLLRPSSSASSTETTGHTLFVGFERSFR
jgi:hypothetical protein